MNIFSKIFIFIPLIVEISCKEIEIEEFKPDPKYKSNGYLDFGTLRVTKIKRNQFSVSGEFEVKENCGDEKFLSLEIRSKNSGGLLMKQEYPICEFLKNEKMIMPDLVEHSNIKIDDCPFKAGKYTVKNFMLDEKKFQTFVPGSYIGRMSLTEKGKVLAASEVTAILKL